MNDFDKSMARDVIEDAFADLDTAYGRGVVSGLCGAFYMCGLLNEEEWKTYLKRIPSERHGPGAEGLLVDTRAPSTAGRGRTLN